jgi:hypothetical protein
MTTGYRRLNVRDILWRCQESRVTVDVGRNVARQSREASQGTRRRSFTLRTDALGLREQLWSIRQRNRDLIPGGRPPQW